MSVSETLFQEAKDRIVGGVNSPARAFKAVGGHPVFIRRGSGAYLETEDGQKLVDYVLSFGPLILGHANPLVVEAIKTAVENGTTYGAPTVSETKLAELVQEFYPSCERLRFVNSGTEATMSAIRLARGYTGRSKIVKFNGCYHGHVDALLVAAGSASMTLGTPDSAGVLKGQTKDTLQVEFNDFEGLEKVFSDFGDEIAGVILEPICGNMGVVTPKEGYLEKLRELCSNSGALLIFDEVMCGFRVEGGSAQAKYNVTPDLTCLGKVVGGGLPCAVYGGRRDVMDALSPNGPVFQAGTLSGNPLAMAAGVATLRTLKEQPQILQNVIDQTTRLVEGIKERVSPRWVVNQAGSMFTLFCTDKSPETLEDVKACDFDAFAKLHRGLLNQGVYLAPSQYEANFLSSSHGDEEIEKTLKALEAACPF